MQQSNTLTAPLPAFMTPEALLEHWQGHRRLTRKLIEIFPEKDFYTFSLGGMRPFVQIVHELLSMAAPGVRGLISGHWGNPVPSQEEQKIVPTKADLLARWDEQTEELNELLPQIPVERFQENIAFFGQYEGPVYWAIMYVIDNEIHHRGQMYVYTRALGIEPPFFWER